MNSFCIELLPLLAVTVLTRCENQGRKQRSCRPHLQTLCLSVIWCRQTQEPQRLHKLLMDGWMTTLLMNALIIIICVWVCVCLCVCREREKERGCLWVYDSLLVLQPNRRPSPLSCSVRLRTHILNTCWLIPPRLCVSVSSHRDKNPKVDKLEMRKTKMSCNIITHSRHLRTC